MSITAHEILAHVRRDGYQPLKLKALARKLGVPSPDYRIFRETVKGLIQQGRLDLGKSRTIRQPESFRYTGDRNDPARADLYKRLHEHPAAQPGENLDFLTRTALAANASSEEIRRLAAAYQPKAEYPDTKLARNLRGIAGLISGGLKTRIYYTLQPGYDTHSNQRAAHDELLTELNDAVIAFQQDLAKHGQNQRVLTFTFSEFSRNIKEYGSQGTDHGHAGAMFFFGAKSKPGLRGTHPSLEDVHQVRNGALKHNMDFRGVYSTVLEKWLRIPAEPILGAFPQVDIIA